MTQLKLHVHITDVCGDAPKTVVCEVPDVTPVDPESIQCDTTDQETIQTTLSQLDIREETGMFNYFFPE